MMCGIDLSKMAAGLTAMLPPFIALITVSILVLQYFLAARTTRLALYDKRYPVYRKTLQFITQICHHGKVESVTELTLFRWYKEENQFLFREDIPTFMELLYKQGTDLLTTATLLEAANDDASIEKYAKRKEELLLWFGDQIAAARTLFGRYLRIPRG